MIANQHTGLLNAAKFRARYNIDDKWRTAWGLLWNKRDMNRLQSIEDRIERKWNLANNRIGKLMRDYDLTN